MRNFSSFVSWSLTFIISMYILRTFGEPASVNLGQAQKLPEGEDYKNYVESDKPAPESSLHYFTSIFGGEPESAPHKEGHSENDKDKDHADESCTTKNDPKVAENDHDDETHVESVDPIEQAKIKVARQVVAPPPAQEGQQNQQNQQQNRTNNNNVRGPSYTVGNGAKQQEIGNNNNNQQQEDQLPKSKNPLDAILEISDPSMRNSMTAFYGSAIGDADCGKKFTCLMGNAVEGFPGRDYFFMFAGRYVPSDWSVLYDIFRISSLYGQNCELYLCQPKQKQ